MDVWDESESEKRRGSGGRGIKVGGVGWLARED